MPQAPAAPRPTNPEELHRKGFMTASGNCVTPLFRVSFPNIFRPGRPIEGSVSEPKYGCVMLFAADADLSLLKAMANAAVAEKWPNQAQRPRNMRSPFRDQGEKAYEGYVPGCIFVTATSKTRPALVNSQILPIDDETQFYAGCYAVASVNAYAYQKAGNAGVAFGLNNIQKIKDGEPFTFRSKPEDDFVQAVSAPGNGAAGAATAADIFR